METIHTRTIFFEIDSLGIHRPCDFARVTTNIGTMLEPRTEFCARHTIGQQIADADMGDEMTMITGIEGIDLDREKFLVGDGVTGGNLMPRSGR
jgi:hypothetical protein